MSVGARRCINFSPDAVIEDRCLETPLEVRALLDAVAADNSVVASLAAKRNPAIEELKQKQRARGKIEGFTQGRTEGLAQGQAQALLQVLEARGLPPSDSQRQRILATTDLDQLRCWLTQAALVASADELEDAKTFRR